MLMKSHAKEIIDAAHKYGVVDLKLEAEASLVRATTFNMENLLDLLLFADSKNCALLKEAAMDYMVDNKGEVCKKISFSDSPGVLISDVLAAFGRGETKGGTDGGNELSVMRISELRWKAHESGLDVDGSREILIVALEENQKRTQMRTQMKPHEVGIRLIDFYALPFYLMISTGQCRVSPVDQCG